jgi:hypothetical protein
VLQVADPPYLWAVAWCSCPVCPIADGMLPPAALPLCNGCLQREGTPVPLPSLSTLSTE